MRYIKNAAELLDIQWDRIDGSLVAEPKIQIFLPLPEEKDQEKIMQGLKTLSAIYSSMHDCADAREDQGLYYFEKLNLPQTCAEQTMVYSQAYRLARRLRSAAAAISEATEQYWDSKSRFPRSLSIEFERLHVHPEQHRAAYKAAYVKVEEAEKDLMAFDARMTRLFADHRQQYCRQSGIRDPLIKSVIDEEERAVC